MRKVYLDNAATTPLLPEVREAMMPFLGEGFGNPSSLHEWGDVAREAVDAAREQVAELIGARAEEVIFTGGGTESNNFAVKDLALAQQSKGKHIVVSAIEHFSVLHSARTLEKMGFRADRGASGQVWVSRTRGCAAKHQEGYCVGLHDAR